MHRHQKFLTISPDKIPLIKENHGKIKNRDLAKIIGVSYNKLHNNLRILGFVHRRDGSQPKLSNDYFNVEEFGKHYSY